MGRSRNAYITALAGAGLSVVVASAACGSEYTPSGEPEPLSTAQPKEASDAAARRDGDDVLEASTRKKTYRGTLAAAPKVKFGGGRFCEYEVTLKEIAIDVGELETGEIGDAKVTNLHVEDALPPCPYEPAEPNIHDYKLSSSTTIENGRRLYFEGAKSNQPKTSLAIDLIPTKTGLDAMATWTRTDQTPPLTWVVTGRIPLERR